MGYCLPEALDPKMVQGLDSGVPEVAYLEGHGDSASALMGTTGVTIWLIGVLSILTKSSGF